MVLHKYFKKFDVFCDEQHINFEQKKKLKEFVVSLIKEVYMDIYENVKLFVRQGEITILINESPIQNDDEKKNNLIHFENVSEKLKENRIRESYVNE